MKGFAFLLFALVAVQARHTGVQQSTRSAAALGDNPWIVHLRVATSNGNGLLETCTGSLIDKLWLLTSASCVATSRFIWVRYGVVTVINPSLVTEASQFRLYPGYDPTTGANNIALINITRVIENTDNISPVRLASSETELPSSAIYCGFGEESGNPGDNLSCYKVGLAQEDGSLTVTSDEFKTSRFDLGAPLVEDGVQFGILTAPATEDSIGEFTPIAQYLSWIEAETGIDFTPEGGPEVIPEIAPETVRFVY